MLIANRSAHKALRAYLESVAPDDADPLFPSRKTGRPITFQMVNFLVKKWAHTINLKGNYGEHTLLQIQSYDLKGLESVTIMVNFHKRDIPLRHPPTHYHYIEILKEDCCGTKKTC
ncbi:hypothetical protein JCM12296A_53810 [Desulfosarcina cetonica]